MWSVDVTHSHLINCESQNHDCNFYVKYKLIQMFWKWKQALKQRESSEFLLEV